MILTGDCGGAGALPASIAARMAAMVLAGAWRDLSKASLYSESIPQALAGMGGS
jgi:hypothetical protein